MSRPKALLSLFFQAGETETWVRGGRQQERLCLLTTPPLIGSEALSPTLLHLAAWKPQASGPPRHLTCGLRTGTEGHEFRVESREEGLEE